MTARPRRAAMLAVLAVLTATVVAAPAAAQDLVCIPTCDVTDSRFLAVTPPGALSSLSPARLEITIAIAGDREEFEIGIFDGDAGLDDLGDPTSFWDFGAAEVVYRLYEDAGKDGVDGGDALIATFLSEELADNDWSDSGPLPTSETARADGGNFFYSLEVELLPGSAGSVINSFKVRSSGPATIEIFQQPFAFIANLTDVPDASVVYPAFPSPTPTTYDGTFSFFLGAETSLDEFLLWDGDLDFGDADDPAVRDTDDPETPNDLTAVPFAGDPSMGIDPFATAAAFVESIACDDPDDLGPFPPNPACRTGIGNPEEDRDGIFQVRPPAVTYTVIAPDGRSWHNPNPSGNREWERFEVSTDPSCVAGVTADYCETEILPAGAYEVRVEGLDMQNLNFFFFTLPLRCVNDDGSSCEELREFVIGDTVFEDPDGDGVQQPGEPGIQGVVTALVDAGGSSLDGTVTGMDGLYLYAVDDGEWTVRVEDGNFDAFAIQGAVGDRVWLDLDGDGAQDGGEPGIPGVEVRLYDAGDDGAAGGGDDRFLAATVTVGNGLYLFASLPPATYYTAVVDPTLPAGLALSGGTDPSAVRTITAGEVFLDLDFGYLSSAPGTAVIGDFVWRDGDSDGLQDAGEPGVDRVTLELVDGGGDGLGGGNDTIVGEATTAGGYYLFANVAPGDDYAVRVTDVDGVLAGYFPTSSPNPIEGISVDAGEAFLAADFGYDTAGALYAIDNVTWYDADRDGIFDGGEPPLGGVTVALADGAGDVLATTTSAADGGFSFGNLPPGVYVIVITDVDAALTGLLPTTDPAAVAALTVEIVDASVSGVDFGYVAGGALQGAVATTASPTQTYTVIDENVLIYDFGYRLFAAGTGTPGYWKNHAEAWPVSEINIGGVLYSQTEAIFILDQGDKSGSKESGDKTYTLGAALIAAKLNTLMANEDSCISYVIYLADLWLQEHPVGSNVRGNSRPWKQAEPLYFELDDYNNGRLCAPARD